MCLNREIIIWIFYFDRIHEFDFENPTKHFYQQVFDKQQVFDNFAVTIRLLLCHIIFHDYQNWFKHNISDKYYSQTSIYSASLGKAK